MLKTTFLAISLDTMIMRFYLMMALAIIGGFSGYWGIALLALPVFLSTILGVKIEWKATKDIPFKRVQLERVEHKKAS